MASSIERRWRSGERWSCGAAHRSTCWMVGRRGGSKRPGSTNCACDAEESLLDARLASGEHRRCGRRSPRPASAEQPLREHRWAILATALYRCGRQADALRALEARPAHAGRAARHRTRRRAGRLGAGDLASRTTRCSPLRPADDLAALPVQGVWCPMTSPTRRRSSAVTARSLRVSIGYRPVRCWWSPVPPVVASRRWCGPGWSRPAPGGHAVVVFVPGSRPGSGDDQRPGIVTGRAIRWWSSTSSRSCSSSTTTLRERARSLCARLASYATDTAPVVVTVRADHVAALAVDDDVRRARRAGPAPRQGAHR